MTRVPSIVPTAGELKPMGPVSMSQTAFGNVFGLWCAWTLGEAAAEALTWSIVSPAVATTTATAERATLAIRDRPARSPPCRAARGAATGAGAVFTYTFFG